MNDGMGGDPGDSLQISSLREDPDRWESAIRAEAERARSDPAARAVVESIYCDENRDAAFERFRGGLEFRAILQLLCLLQVPASSRICEIGGGPGWLTWALHTAGYTDVALLEPNANFVTGTGYLRSRADSGGIRVWNDIDAWYANAGRYDLILTHNCVHHFRGLEFIAASIRQKIDRAGRWLMLREWYAETPAELYEQLRLHPYSQRFGVYEFPYPVSHYVDALEFVGFELQAVVPSGYANSALETYVQDEGGSLVRSATRAVDSLLRHAPRLTAALFQVERVANHVAAHKLRRFTRPAAMLFGRRHF